jgi:hypothetical protein
MRADADARRAATIAGVFPSAQQTRLLRAALLSGDVALRAWHEWANAIDWDARLDASSFRLLPLLHANMLRHGIEHPAMNKLKDVFERSWSETTLAMHRMKPVVAALKDAGVDVMLVKGAQLALAYYQSLGVRPMQDIDIVVPTAAARAAIALMERRGWKRAQGAQDDDVVYRHAMLFTDTDRNHCDLHWHVIYECCQPDADHEFWQGAEPLDFVGVSVKMLGPADALLLAIIHGMRTSLQPTIRWVADAVTIVQVAGVRLDWDRLVQQARQRKLSQRLRLGLAFLTEHLDVAVPPPVLERLSVVRISRMERTETHYALEPHATRSRAPLGSLTPFWAAYRRFVDCAGPWCAVWRFPHYLRWAWHVTSRDTLLGVIVRKARKRAPLFLTRRAAPSRGSEGARPGAV